MAYSLPVRQALAQGNGSKILNHLEKLTPAKQPGKFICPVCGGNDLAISEKGTTCYTGGCSWKAIMDAIAPLQQQDRDSFAKTKARPKSQKERDRAATLAAAQVEVQVDHVVQLVLNGVEGVETGAIQLDTWCKANQHNTFAAGQLLRKKLKEAGAVQHASANNEFEIDPQDVAEVRSLQDCPDFEIDQILPPKIADPINQLAKVLNLPAAPFGGAILAASASMLNPMLDLVVNRKTNHRVNALLWVVHLGSTGSLKTLVQDTATKPLDRFEIEAQRDYDAALKEYEAEIERIKGDKEATRPETPKRREYCVKDFNREALIKPLQNNPNKGLLGSVDELAGFFKSFDQYRKGKGGDMQAYLTLYNGGMLKVSRASGVTGLAEKTNLSILGGVQPEVLKKLIKAAGIEEGLWSRFLIFNVPEVEIPFAEDGPTIDIGNLLGGLYTHLQLIQSGEIDLSPAAREEWKSYHYWLEERRKNTAQEAVKGLFPKARTNAARVALVAHCIATAAQGSHTPPRQISLETVQGAIALTKHCLNNSLLLFGAAGLSDADPGLVKLLQFAKSNDGKRLKYRDVRRVAAQGKRRDGERLAATKAECLQFFGKLANLGVARMAGDGEVLIQYRDPLAGHEEIPDFGEVS